jgi:hypothetical protein
MCRPHCVAALLVLAALSGCATDQPLCRYWSDAPIGKDLDPSAVPMLPENPYWTSKGFRPAAAAQSGQDICAGEPGHPAPAID